MPHPIKRALLTVSDKLGLVEFGKSLENQGVEILSTGGSAKVLRGAGVSVIEVSEYTGFPEIMDGRVKTLQPAIHGGLLAVRGNDEHEAAMTAHNILPIDLLAANLYPFESKVADGSDFNDCIENIDIGGPALIRAAAKNHAFVTVVVDPSDYGLVIDQMKEGNGSTTEEFRRHLAAIAYSRTGAYDAAISRWFTTKLGIEFPRYVTFGGEIKQTLRYGENPHQRAALYTDGEGRPGVVTASQIQGKAVSFNNLNDTNAAFELAAEFTNKPTCVIVKHANPCGVAEAEDLETAYKRALSCDKESAFGGIIAFNQSLDSKTANELIKVFAEVVIAPKITPEAVTILGKNKNLRVFTTGKMPDPTAANVSVLPLASGYLCQSRDNTLLNSITVVSKRSPTESEMHDLKFALTVCKHVKSNAIVFAKNGMTVGVGAGQMSRINSARIATWKAEEAARVAGHKTTWAKGSVLASDAFFPFADGLLNAVEAGVTAVIQPGGSLRDNEVIAAANEKNIAMVHTGMRHFKH
ncbi:MAG: bifunctional phosphoribosylaminoimidazolecarboxamide formyltransferase/IMP cyclohydrolase [Rhodospirillaceae bacterium TMED8]|nr:bifunctional phosphoribosylaminoimidazolecarboxamide formyltransferase/inosine monophosphate cyclohydrolase [Magnetovibrio sp.]OUT47932.1 MAG: bifunctional phosphoribosylaminoimidazolecarboxamide formyltransferase/IMP cyclohydrolase [Rhodospirillaceae bacterium TMED8]